MHMSQFMVSLVLSQDQLVAVDQALAAIESQLSGLVALTSDQRRSLTKMGEKSETFCRQTLSLLDQNRQVVPPSVELDGVLSDLVTLDQLRPRLQRLQRLSERAADTESALGNDVMVASLQGYALLKVVGKNQGLEALCRGLGSRFARLGRPAEPKAA
jgi:hypothetical protein